MNYGKKKRLKSIIAGILAVAIVFATAPTEIMETFAAAGNNNVNATGVTNDNYRFKYSNPSDMSYKDGLTLDNPVVDENGNTLTNVEYSSSDDEIASVDENNGQVTVHKAGEITVSAVIDDDASTPLSYELNIKKASQEKLSVVAVNNSYETEGIPDIVKGQSVDIKVAGGSGNGVVKAEIVPSDSEIATIASNEDGTYKINTSGEGTFQLKVSKAADDNYSDANFVYNVTVISDETADDMRFAISTADVIYSEGMTFSNILLNNTNVSKVNYSLVDDNKIASIDESGKITVNSAGTVKVEASIERGEKASYTLNIAKAPRNNFIFENINVEDIEYGNTIKNSIVDGSSVKYTSSDNNIVSVDNDGNITANGIGKATITASIDADLCYEEATASYNIVVIKAKRNLSFEKTGEQSITYDPVNTSENKFTNTVSVSDGATVEYSVVGSDSNATVDGSGTVKFSSPGTYTIKALVNESDNYKAGEAVYVLNVEKAQQEPLKFDKYPNSSSVNVSYGESPDCSATGGSTDKDVKYSIDNTDVATIDTNGKLTINKVGTVVIVASKEGNETYDDVSARLTINIGKIDQEDLSFEIPNHESINYGDNNNTFSNTIINAGSREVTYYVENDSNIATVNSESGILTINSAGSVTVTAIVACTDIYNEQKLSYTLEIFKADQGNFAFTDTEFKHKFKENITHEAQGGSGEGSITYSIKSGGDIVTIDQKTGVVHTIGVGTAVIMATKAADDCYNSATAEYTLIIEKADQAPLYFKRNECNLSYGQTDTIQLDGGNGSGAVSYTIVNQTYNGNTVNDVITIGEDGKITANNVGTVELSATKAGDECYNEISTSEKCIITVTPIDRDCQFDSASIEKTYDSDNCRFTNSITDSQDDQKWEYSVTKQVPDDATESVVVIVNSLTGEVDIKASGIATITASIPAGRNYNAAKKSYDIKINKASQTGFKFASQYENSFDVLYGTKNITLNTLGGQSKGDVTYSILEGGDIASVDSTTGLVTFNSGKDGTVKIQAVKKSDGRYNSTSSETVINVKRCDFSDKYTVTGTEGKDGWYVDDISIKAETGYSVCLTDGFDDDWSDSLILGSEGSGNKVEFYIRKNDDDNKPISSKITEEYKLDKTIPVVENIEYSEFVGSSIFDKIFNFFKDPAKVTVTVSDKLPGSEIDKIVYEFGNKKVTVSQKDITKKDDTETGTFVFTIKAPNNGSVKVTAYDKAGNESVLYDDSDNQLIVDNIGSNITLTSLEEPECGIYCSDAYVDVSISDTGVYSGLKKVTYSIEAPDIDAYEEGVLFDESTGSYASIIGSVSSYDEDADVKIDKIKVNSSKFNSNKVTVTVTAVDNSGNTSTSECDLKIDITVPVVEVKYDRNDPEKEKYFDGYRKATISVTERNFDSDKVNVIVNGSEYTPKLSEWTEISGSGNGDNTVHQAVVLYNHDGDYEFGLTCSDTAGNVASADIFAEGTKAGSAFTIDTVKPVISVSYDRNRVNKEYYNDIVTGTITITERNFSDSDVIITVEKRLDNENDYQNDEKTYSKTDFKENGETDGYSLDILFDEDADYKLSVNFTDSAGNTADQITDGFTVDLTTPVIMVSYDNNNASNENRFKADRTAKIVIDEHNFRVEDVNFVVTAKDASGRDVSIPDYNGILKNSANWQDSGDIHTAMIVFDTEAVYNISIGYIDLAGHANTSVKFASGTKGADTFTIDKTVPEGTVRINGWTQEWTGFPANKNSDDRSFSLYDNKTVTVNVSSSDSLSGVDYVEQFRSADIISLDQAISSTEWKKVSLDSSGSFSYSVEPDESFVAYVHIVDKAGNERYITSDGIIVDSTLPDVERVAPVVTVNPVQSSDKSIYNGDVLVNVDVKDPISGNSSYSGLKNVKYKVYNTSITDNGGVTEEGVLFNYDIASPQRSQLVQWVSSSDNDAIIQIPKILVESSKNNSNDIIVEVTATDNSGNVSTGRCSLNIDTTAPRINISYDNNDADNDKYFKNDRTATIIITERNFNPDDVKLDISASDGTIPGISAWVRYAGTGNLDDTTWTATIKYGADADYEFDISFKDEAGNDAPAAVYAAGTIAAQKFTVDKTIPVINVSYDNLNSYGSNYFNNSRTATIAIVDHNFDPNDAGRISVEIISSDDGNVTAAPSIGIWTSNGDVHTAQVLFGTDGYYTLNVTAKDKAGNDAAEFEKQSFYIDLKDPELDISGVDNMVAYNGSVAPVITYSDTNYDSGLVSITLTGVNRGNVDIKGTYSDIHNGRVFSFDNFANTKDVDDIYTLTVSLTDKAGRTTSKSVTFSVNRFGSTYALDDAAKKLNGTYVQKAGNVVISEVNANKLSDIKVVLFKNNETITLKEGVDFKVEISGGNGTWYEYKYTVFAENFEDDGVYRISVHSQDEAGNVAENTLDTKKTEMSFGVDKTAPTITVDNLDAGKTYPVDNLTVNISVNDNLLLSTVTIYLDDYNKPYKTWSAEEVSKIVSSNGEFIFDITGDSKDAHKVKIVAMDAAGIETEQEITGFYVTTDVMVRYYNNKPLFIGSIAGVIIVASLIIFLVLYRKKKNGDK